MCGDQLVVSTIVSGRVRQCWPVPGSVCRCPVAAPCDHSGSRAGTASSGHNNPDTTTIFVFNEPHPLWAFLFLSYQLTAVFFVHLTCPPPDDELGAGVPSRVLVTMLPLLLVCLHLPPLLCQLPLSPLSLLGTIWSSVHRPRNLQVSCD